MCADVCPSQARGLSQTFRMYAAIGHMLQQKRKTSYGLILIRPRSICIMDADNFRVRPILCEITELSATCLCSDFPQVIASYKRVGIETEVR